MGPMQLQDLAGKCATLFKIRASSRVHAFDDEYDEKQILDTQKARFNLWAADQGVFAEGNGSLDARLQEHEDITGLVKGQLLSILRHLGRLETYKSDQGGNKEIHAAELAYEDDDASSMPSESTFSTITSGDTFPVSTRPESMAASEPIEEREVTPLASIIHAINRLHRVGMAIRRAGATSHDSKAAMGQFYDDDGVDVVDVFREWSLQLLHHKFKTADGKTLHRIAHTNAERRRVFLYRKKHQKKLMGRRTDVPAETLERRTMSKRLAESFGSLEVGDNVRLDGKKALRPTAPGSTAPLSETVASRVARNAFRYEPSIQPTMTSAAPSTQILLDSSIYPPAPKVLAGAAEFYCPYCCKVHPATERSGRRWKSHFLKDLSPYVCLVEHCQEPYKLYPDQQSWTKHMESHSTRYTCKQHPKVLQFSTEAEFDQHILRQHRQLAPARLARLRSFNSSTGKLDISNCPICGFVPSKAPSPGKGVASHAPAYDELLSHIAKDLHYIAMWSLDGNDEADDIPSDGSDLRVADDSTRAADLVSNSFDRRDKSDDLAYWHHDPLHSSIEVAEAPDTIPEGADPGDEWYMMQRRHNEYDGHDLDPKLVNFVQRHQLEQILKEGKTADPQLPCYMLPSRSSKNFYGRQSTLERLEGNLHPAKTSKSLRTVTLGGPAGIGKTELAWQYCQNYENQYDVVLWFHADQESKLENDFMKAAVSLGFVGRDSAESRDHIHCRQSVKAWLSNPLKSRTRPEESEDASWLLVFDHIINYDILNNYWPTNSRSGSILITSRKAMPWTSPSYQILEVEPFDSTESAAFLSTMVKAEDMGGQGLRLGPRAVHSPTQLIFLAKMIKLDQYSLQRFCEASQEDDGKNVILTLHTEDATKNQSDFAEWALDSLTTTAADLLDAMSMMDPDQIVERMLTLPPDDISIPSYPRSLEEYYDARAELLKFSFITRDKSTSNLNVHRLIQDAARNRMSTEYYRDVLNTCVALINDEWPYQPFTWRHSIKRWPKCEELYPHIVQLQWYSEAVDVRDDDITGGYDFARLATDVAWYCHEKGRSEKSEEFCEMALRVCRKLRDFLEKDPALSDMVDVAQIDRTIGEVYHNHGCITAEMNRPKEALQYQLTFNKMMQDELGADPGMDMRLAMSFNELGVAYMINNDYAKGEECFQRSTEEMKRLDNFEDYKISLPLVNEGYCRCLAGENDVAEEIFLKGLADRLEYFGESDLDSFISGRFYHGLGNAKLGQGLEQESFEYLKKAREHYTVTLGRGHHRTADVAVALGRHYYRVDDNTKAVEQFSTALDAYGDRNIYAPEKTRALYQRAKALRGLGREAEAQANEERCLKAYREIAPDDQRPLNELEDEDFDEKIVFWSR